MTLRLQSEDNLEIPADAKPPALTGRVAFSENDLDKVEELDPELKQKAEELKKQKELRKNKVKTKYEEALFNIGDPLLPRKRMCFLQNTTYQTSHRDTLSPNPPSPSRANPASSPPRHPPHLCTSQQFLGGSASSR